MQLFLFCSSLLWLIFTVECSSRIATEPSSFCIDLTKIYTWVMPLRLHLGQYKLEKIKNESQTKLNNPINYLFLFIPQVLQQDNTSTMITHEQNRPSNNTSLLSSIKPSIHSNFSRIQTHSHVIDTLQQEES